MKKIFVFTIFLFVARLISAQVIDTGQFTKWIDDNSIELNSNKDSKFEKLVELIKDKPVIGLGECVHASKTINVLRFDIAKALIAKGDYRILAFEMSFNTGLRINNYLQTGQGDINQIIKESHFFINSAEMLEFIQWIRNFNIKSDKPIILYGFDIQSNIDIAEDLLSYYEKVEKAAASLTSSLIKMLNENEMISFGEYSKYLQDSVITIMNRLVIKHNLNKKDYILKQGFIEYEYSGKRIDVLSQYLQQLNSGYAQSLKMRDSCNANLVKWIKDFEGEDSKVILFAHNAHLANAYKYTPRVRTLSTQGFYEDYPVELVSGFYLKKIFGYNNYYFIGTQFSHGFFMGFDPENEFVLSKLEVTPPEPNSFTYLLQQAKKTPYFISFDTPYQKTPRPIVNYLRSLQSFYEIGAAYDFKYTKARLIDYFDAVIFIDKIEASHLLKQEK